MILIKQGHVFSPEDLGCCDILTGSQEILAVEKRIEGSALPGEVRVIDAGGKAVVPGFIDGHQHFTGGGGEDGFKSRTPEMTLSMNIKSGVTTAVGLLGTDSQTRTVENLYAKTQGFNHEGLTAFMLTGSYWLPSPTVCGSVGRDITFLDPVIGVKLAMADHRGPCYGVKELAALAAEVRVAALVSGKPGIITVHTGANPEGLDKIFNAVDHYATGPDIFIPTHINRKNPKMNAQALDLAEKGAFIDATCLADSTGEDTSLVSAADFALTADTRQVFDRVCFSSDAGGSLPRWNKERTRILGMGIGTPASLLSELRRLVLHHGMDLSRALLPLTQTPAKAYGLAGKKGELTPGAHADILILDKETLEIRDVLAKGRVMMADRILEQKGYFE
ncbi:MAG: beta-aspartyl-peptidase [Desulfobacterales bacterium]|nr:beta-aspartyl-peptidase [Desulfobacterales bacterium]